MEEEPFDELMGPPRINLAKQKALEEEMSGPPPPAVVSPEPSPTNETPRASGFSAPPMGAFASHTPDRWTQYERDEKRLEQESRTASANAVFSAAKRAANKQMDMSYAEDEFYASQESRLTSHGASLPHPDEHRGFNNTTSRKSNYRDYDDDDDDDDDDEDEIIYPHDRVRAEALKVLEMADSGVSPKSLHRTKSGGYSTESMPKKKRVPAALSGIDFRKSARTNSNRRNFEDRRWTIDDSDEDNDDDLVDIVQMEKRTSSRQERQQQQSKRSWSSRYNVDHRLLALTGGGASSAKEILDSMDRDKEHELIKMSARNMFRSSPHQQNASVQKKETKIFGSGFTFRAKHVFGPPKTQEPSKNTNLHDHKTVWMDVDLQANGRSLPPPPPLKDRHLGPMTYQMIRRRRLRLCAAAVIAVVLVAVLAGVFGSKAHVSGGDNSVVQADSANTVRFHVTADVPFDTREQKKLTRDLETLPGDTEFLIHLGNVQDAFSTLCPQSSYADARVILQQSPVPVFVLPGPHDWNNCPNPPVALLDWTNYLGRLEDTFVHNLGVERQLGNRENFAFIRKKVLFLGLHLVNGRIDDPEAWRIRHARVVQWVEQQMSTNKDNYRAVVMMGNARPSQQLEAFFGEVLDDVRESGKPVLYLHANSGNGLGVERYRPFQNTPNLLVVQIDKGGSTPPVKVSVGAGNNPFHVA